VPYKDPKKQRKYFKECLKALRKAANYVAKHQL